MPITQSRLISLVRTARRLLDTTEALAQAQRRSPEVFLHAQSVVENSPDPVAREVVATLVSRLNLQADILLTGDISNQEKVALLLEEKHFELNAKKNAKAAKAAAYARERRGQEPKAPAAPAAPQAPSRITQIDLDYMNGRISKEEYEAKATSSPESSPAAPPAPPAAPTFRTIITSAPGPKLEENLIGKNMFSAEG